MTQQSGFSTAARQLHAGESGSRLWQQDGHADLSAPSAERAMLLQRPADDHLGVADAGLRRVLGALVRMPSVGPRLILLGAGMTPIAALALALAQVAPLHLLSLLMVFPALAGVTLLGMWRPAWGRRALVGVLAGLLATGVYDLFRLGLVAVGFWGDPIPGIGVLLLDGQPTDPLRWSAGYLWRYLADGGAMGAAYAALPRLDTRSGIAFGVAVCTGLVLLLLIAPQAQEHFLPLSPATAVAALTGHLIYGAVLGQLAGRWHHPATRLPRWQSLTVTRTPPSTSWALGRWLPRGATDGHSKAPSRGPNGGVVAVVVAAGVGCAVLGVLSVGSAGSDTIAALLTFYPPGGPLTGSSSVASLVFVLTWANLHVRIAHQHLVLARSLRVALALIALGLLGTFPPLQDLVG